MAHFYFQLSDFKDHGVLAKAFNANTINRSPDGGKPLPLGTTQARDPQAQVSMTTYSLSEIMQGSAITKPAVAPYDAFNQILSGSLSEMLADPQASPQAVLGNQQVLVPDDVLASAGSQGAGLLASANTSSSTTGAGGTINAQAASPQAESAIKWMTDRKGDTSLNGRCETAVELALSGHAGWQASAISDWRSHTEQHTDTNPPRGALVFWNTSVNGHVGISLGDGTAISTSSKEGGIGVSPIIGYFKEYLGWTDNNLIQQ